MRLALAWPLHVSVGPGHYETASTKCCATMKTMLGWFVCLCCLSAAVAVAEEISAEWELGPTGTKASLRGLSAPSERWLWAAGSSATIIRSEDGGSSWVDCSPSGYPQLEFRSIHAWNNTTACAASAGTPAVILRTTDAGRNWTQVYSHPAAEAFFDGLRFWDEQRGIAFSDPVGGKLLIVSSQDAGRTWTAEAAEKLPQTLEHEAGFAASNSALCIGEGGAVWIGTGGAERPFSRVHLRTAWDAGWQVVDCPLPSGAAQGIFSIAIDGDQLVAVGGDYRPDNNLQPTAAGSSDGGLSWQVADVPPAAFRSAVVALPGLQHAASSRAGTRGFIATGPKGSDFSIDGRRWEAFSTHGFHALTVASTTIFGVGADGRFGRLNVQAE